MQCNPFIKGAPHPMLGCCFGYVSVYENKARPRVIPMTKPMIISFIKA
jgi:hypothetical protein